MTVGIPKDSRVIHRVNRLIREKVYQATRARPSVWVFTLAGVVLFGAMVAFVIYSLYHEGSVLLAQLTHINLLGIGLSFILYSGALALAILGWSAIAGRLTNVRDLKRHVKVYCYTNLARRIPGFFWYVLGRAHLYRHDGAGIVSISAASAIEMALIVLSGLMSYALLNLGRWPIRWTWGLIVGIGVGLVMMHPRLLQWILSKVKHVNIVEHIRYRDVAIWLAVYISVWVLGGLALFSVVWAIQPLALVQVPGIIACWSLSGAVSTLVVFLPAGLGVREATLSMLLLPFIPAPLAVTVALMMRVLLTLYEIVWALIAIRI
ncbi:MAG: hypothetical protein JXB26_06270 [Candidatus Aminicenantes bacterium]|nr:hypothetical protein [Candidatus Aminicenantes bacterium]